MCTLWMSNATNLSHIDSISKEFILNTLVEAILRLSCVPIFELIYFKLCLEYAGDGIFALTLRPLYIRTSVHSVLLR